MEAMGFEDNGDGAMNSTFAIKDQVRIGSWRELLTLDRRVNIEWKQEGGSTAEIS